MIEKPSQKNLDDHFVGKSHIFCLAPFHDFFLKNIHKIYFYEN